MPYPSKTDRKQILAAAMKQLEREGMREVSLRGVAGELGLSPNALYRYFADRADLEGAMGTESTRRYHAWLAEAANGKAAEEALREMAWSSVRFAREHPFLYQAMTTPYERHAEFVGAHGALWDCVVEQVRRLSGADRARTAAVALWAFLHGFVILEEAAVFGEEKPANGFEYGLEAWLAAAGTGKLGGG